METSLGCGKAALKKDLVDVNGGVVVTEEDGIVS